MSNKSFDEKTTNIMVTLHKVFTELDISAYLIGAQARDVWFLPIKASRITYDIDWVIAHSNETIFNELKRILIEREGFTQNSNPLRLQTKEGIEVDLIPFDFAQTPHFVGLREIFERGTEIILFANNEAYKVATLPSVVLLKLVAWDNRPDKRAKDIDDIAFILQHYDIYSDEILDNHYDLYNELDAKFIGARMIGIKIKEITNNSANLKSQIINIIEKQIALNSKSPMVKLLMQRTEEKEDIILQHLNQILIGIKD